MWRCKDQFFLAPPLSPLVIVVLSLVGSGWLDRLLIHLPVRVRRVIHDALLSAPPGALGRVFVKE